MMTDPLHRLFTNLETQLEGHNALLGLLREENAAAGTFNGKDVALLETMQMRKYRLLSELERLDIERTQLISTYAAAAGLPENISLAQIAGRHEVAQSKRLLELRDQLKRVTGDIIGLSSQTSEKARHRLNAVMSYSDALADSGLQAPGVYAASGKLKKQNPARIFWGSV